MQIQELFELSMKRSIPELVETSSPDGLVLNLGAGFSPIVGADNLDRPNWIAERDLLCVYEDESVDLIHAYHFFEHLEGESVIALLRDCQRVLVKGGTLNIVVPYYRSSMQGQDLTHKSKFNETTWATLFANNYYNPSSHNWALKAEFNIIIGIVERNLCLMTQLIKED